MKRYSVIDLFVVEVDTIDGPQYFICKRSLGNSYTEIFTNRKIIPKNEHKVTSLEYYYPSIDKTMIKQLYVDKRELLNTFLEINKTEKQNTQESSNDAISILDEATTKFFAGDGSWSSVCFKRLYELSMAYLPCHLHEDIWLAKMLIKDQELTLDFDQVLDYIKTSPFFAEKKHDYAQRIVAWQIDWITSGGENWITDEKYGNDFIFYSPDCDKGVRDGVLKTLKFIGMDEAEIEEGIEKNASMWRDKMMKMAFNNIYNPLFFDYNPDFTRAINIKNCEEIIEPLPAVNPLLEKYWFAMRKYEYYQEHKESVDQFGEVESDMKMTKEEADKVNESLKQLHNDRMYQLLNYRRARKEARQNRNLKM